MRELIRQLGWYRFTSWYSSLLCSGEMVRGVSNQIRHRIYFAVDTLEYLWPYFGLPGNLERTPRVWTKPNTGTNQPPTAPFKRDDDFHGPRPDKTDGVTLHWD